ncbi:MAG: hypothetical protein V1820_03705 [archaeon]
MGRIRGFSRAAQVSIDFLFFAVGISLVFVSFLHFAVGLSEGISSDFTFFRDFSGMSVEGDRLLLNPEKGLAGTRFGRPADHLLREIPEGLVISAETGRTLREGNSTGICSWRAGVFEGRVLLFSVCSR